MLVATTENYLILSWNVLLGTGTYCTPELEQGNAAPTVIGGLVTHLKKEKERRRLGVSVHSTETLGGPHVESKIMAAGHFKP